MKTIGCFFTLLLVLAVVCKGNEETALRIDFNDAMFSKLDEEGRNVIREYANAYQKIKDFYGNIRMDVTKRLFKNTAADDPVTYVPLNSSPILLREELYEVRYNTRDGGFSRVDSQVQFHLLPDDGKIQHRGHQMNYARQIRLFTPDMAYILSNTNASNPYYSLTMKRDYKTLLETVGFAILEFDTAPFAVGPTLMEDIFFRKALYFKRDAPYFIVSARYEDDRVNPFVELTARLEIEEEKASIWIVRLSRENWVVLDTFYQGWTAKGKYWNRSQCQYIGEFEGMPLLSSYWEDYGIYDPDDGETERMISRVQYDVTQIIPGPVDLSEFDVAQFLPPNVKIGEVTQAQLSPARIVAIIIGIILIILGIYLKIRSIRKE